MLSVRFMINIVKWVSMLIGWQFTIGNSWYYFATVAKMLPVINVLLNPIIYM